jgi:hypothetical protein
MAVRSLEEMTETVVRIVMMMKHAVCHFERADLLRELQSDSARTHDADDGGRAGVRFSTALFSDPTSCRWRAEASGMSSTSFASRP